MGRRLREAAEELFSRVPNTTKTVGDETVTYTVSVGDLRTYFESDPLGRAITKALEALRPCKKCSVDTARRDSKCLLCGAHTSDEEESEIMRRRDEEFSRLMEKWRDG